MGTSAKERQDSKGRAGKDSRKERMQNQVKEREGDNKKKEVFFFLPLFIFLGLRKK